VPENRSGAAELHLHRGEYVAEYAEQFGSGVITYTGRRRERDLRGERLYEMHTRSIRLAPGEWVEWR
jgi:hypothetical protein